jgi:uncharacterized protein with PIN domain
LRAPAIRGLVEAGAIQLSLFDQRDLAEITAPDYPGERLVVCRNPLLAEERSRKRGELLDATEKKLTAIAQRVRRATRPLRGKDKIALAVGRVIDHYKMAKHFAVTITDDALTITRNTAQIEAEAALDGVYVLRTSLKAQMLDAVATVTAYKQLAHAERAFRSLKTVDIEVRPIHHRRADRVRAHVFLCMLAYYVEWHMRQALKPIRSTITTRRPPTPPAPPSSPRPGAPPPPIAKRAPSAPTTGSPSTASVRCSAISPPSPTTQWRWLARPTPPS